MYCKAISCPHQPDRIYHAQPSQGDFLPTVVVVVVVVDALADEMVHCFATMLDSDKIRTALFFLVYARVLVF